MGKNKLIWAYIFTISSMVIWGISYIWVKELYRYYNPISTVFIRMLFSSAFLFLLGMGLKKIHRIQKKDIGLLLLLALFDPFGYFLCESHALQYASATTVSIIISMIPLFTPFAAYFFLNEKVTVLNVFGMIISFIGVMLVVVKDDFSLTISPSGIVLLFTAIILAVAFTILLVKLLKKYNIILIFLVINTLTIIYFLPLFFIFGYSDFILVPLTSKIIFYFAGLGIFASSLAFIMYSWGLRVIGAVKANVFSNLMPIFTAFFAFIFLSEIITVRTVFGILIVISGLVLTQIRKKNTV